jgi:nondiscriminating aspartyl-tRNA synthetase
MLKEGGQLSPFLKRPETFLGHDIDFKGTLFRFKDMGNFAFLHITIPNGIIQCINTGPSAHLQVGQCLAVSGRVKEAHIKDAFLHPKTVEVEIKKLEILSTPSSPMPFDITKKNLNLNNDILFDQRMISMRYPKEKAIFKIQEGLVQGFRKFFTQEGLTEIRTPKIVKEGAEGGANIFELEYFGKKAYLTQSPQFYKEFCTGVFGRVFEIAPVFRAEKHNTNRHLNEYTSIDVEMGPIANFEEIMQFEVGAIKSAFRYLAENYQYELNLLEVELNHFESIPCLSFSQAKEIAAQTIRSSEEERNDLTPAEEMAICAQIKRETGSDLVFITHYPSTKRPFYAKDDPNSPGETLSFDLLYRGVEITTGGQRIHQLEELEEKMISRGMNPKKFEFFSQAHRYGLPPHGGFGMGLERLTQKLLGLDNIKRATMFPRDTVRLTP